MTKVVAERGPCAFSAYPSTLTPSCSLLLSYLVLQRSSFAFSEQQHPCRLINAMPLLAVRVRTRLGW